MAVQLRVRRAREDDAWWTWKWANDPEVRAASFHVEPISWVEHQKWFTARLADARSAIYIVSDDDGSTPMALVRFERKLEESREAVEVSLTVGTEFRGRGVGAGALNAACQEYGRQFPLLLVAYVRPSNAASLRTFEKGGFVVSGGVTVDGCGAVKMERLSSAIPPRQVGYSGPIIFRVDVGERVGLGHLSRCLSLADAFGRRGHAIRFVCPVDAAAERIIKAAGFASERLHSSQAGDGSDGSQLEELAAWTGASMVVVDSYRHGGAYTSRLRAAGLFVVVVDDLALGPFSCHVVINGGVHAGRLSYRSVSGDTRFLLGPQYAMLRREFHGAPVRVIGETILRILLTVGGTDSKNVMPRLLALVDRHADADCAIDVVIGPMFRNRRAIEIEAGACRRPVRLLEGCEDLLDAILAADLVVSGGGQTLYELAATGTPAVALVLHDNQVAGAEALVDAGTAAFGGVSTGGELPAQLPAAVAGLLHNRDARERMSVAGRRLIDGRGADRVTAAVERLR